MKHKHNLKNINNFNFMILKEEQTSCLCIIKKDKAINENIVVYKKQKGEDIYG